MTKIKTIITGHGNFANGIKSSLLLLASLPENYYFVDFEESMSPDQLSETFEQILQPNEEFVFFTDLLGGTPFKEAAKLSVNNRKVEVVTGCNLGALLETIYNSYENVSDYANDLIKISKQGTQLLKLDSSPIQPEDNTEFDDGI
ncbi:PTS sugar transporter subunit IIA [Pediococcus ethanolidurans]|uniref:PTS system, N-acetylgalactosamine-specific IIA component n=1 Tax=Pediococcus ethanolidurans TaxID=319653 RepID=A0A0R2KAS8_9LACO|nr:PTS sugar transporter subunit IIA [Pediococcus ethanolidurans]KRN83575.1 hypothetical protein IV87_GL000044 [Pediococcus ethanolidurans]GEN94070.1 PTS sugar transporter subunit IIA [Pediococcus ethanolidurans]SER03982.1 PTS system, N-acetylgalactosamine-specific IIA component [Pediococcus ethanolidurans]